MTIAEMGASLRAGKVSCVELAREAIRKAEASQERLNAFITITADQALRRAAELDTELAKGMDRGPLHGIPIAHKDCLFTKGVRTTWGSRLFADFIPDRDADAVRRLNEAGAVSIGKTNLHELTYGMTSTNPHYGPVRNPWDTSRVPGGSSGGSGAVVAAGIVPLATGTDTGGSIRIPASFCGVVGFKPTFDRISRDGCFPLGLTLDHVGPMAGSVADVTVGFQGMGGGTYLAGDLHSVRIGVPSNFFFDRIDPEVSKAVRRVADEAASAQASVIEVKLPDAAELNALGRVIQLAEAAAVFSKYADRREDFGADVLALFDQGRMIPATQYLNAQRARRVLADEFAKVWKAVDCLLTPATPTAAPRIGETTVQIGAEAEDVRISGTRLARPINVLGWPAVVMPCGRTANSLPIGMQLLGKPGGDERLLGIAGALESLELG